MPDKLKKNCSILFKVSSTLIISIYDNFSSSTFDASYKQIQNKRKIENNLNKNFILLQKNEGIVLESLNKAQFFFLISKEVKGGNKKFTAIQLRITIIRID